MPSLSDTIARFHDYILGKSDAIEQLVVGDKLQFRKQRLSVYAQGYLLRFYEALSSDFPALKKWLGERTFESFVDSYVAKFPSRCYALQDFGAHFETFLRSLPKERLSPVAAEMAAFEWALSQATLSEDALRLNFDTLSLIPPEKWGDLTFTLHPSVHILQCTYDVPALWQHLLQTDQKKPALNPQESPIYCVVWYVNQQSCFRKLTPAAHKMLQLIAQGTLFSEVCQSLCDQIEDEKGLPFVAATLRAWITEGLFCALPQTACQNATNNKAKTQE